MDNEQQNHDIVVCLPILKNSQNVKIHKSILTPYNANFIKISGTPLKGPLV